jgi:nucleoside diphosphate kinase
VEIFSLCWSQAERLFNLALLATKLGYIHLKKLHLYFYQNGGLCMGVMTRSNTLSINKYNNIGFLVIQGDSFYLDKVTDILEYLENANFLILDYEFKQIFFESDKEEMYVKNLNNQKNYWWFGKEVFEFGPALGLFLYKDTCKDIFEILCKIKGKANPTENTEHNIRKDIGALCTSYNLIHTSDNREEMLRESALFFSDSRIKSTLEKIENRYGYLRKELSLLNYPRTNGNDIYKHFLGRVMVRILSFCRNNIKDDEVFAFIDEIYKEENISIKEENIQFLIELIKKYLRKNNILEQHILFGAFLEYMSLILIKRVYQFKWEVFWELCRLNEIKIGYEDKLIITAIHSFND